MKTGRVVWAVLLAAIVAAALVYRQWSGAGRPSPTAGRPEADRGQQALVQDQGRQEAPATGPQAGPAAGGAAEQAAPAPSPAGARAQFAPPAATPEAPGPRPAATPGARKRQAQATAELPADSRADRSGKPPVPRVRVKPSNPRLADYFRAVSAEVGDRWRLPASAGRRNAAIPVVLKIARDGRVLWALIDGSSGDAAIDASVATMIEGVKREGLPPLPDHYPYDELDIGLVLNPAGVG